MFIENAQEKNGDDPPAMVDGVMTVKVRKPVDFSAKKIRDAVLRDNFGYMESDIAEFNKQYPNKYVIQHSGEPGDWASVAQVKGWKVGTDGLTEIDLPAVWTEAVSRFRDLRILIAVSQASGAITNPDLRREFVNFLYDILRSTGEKRLDALRNLINLLSAVVNSRAEVITAFNYLSAQGFENDPFVQLARARAMLDDGANNSQIAVMLHNALRIISERYNSSDKRNLFWTTGSSEAAYFNREAAWMFNQTGNDEEFQDRDWTARFYAMRVEEKATLNAGDIIEFTPPGPASIGTPRPLTNSQDQLNKVEQQMARTQEQWKQLDNATRINEKSDPEAGDSGTLTATRENVKTQVWDRKDGKKPSEQSRPSQYKIKRIDIPLNQRGLARGNAVIGGGLSLIMEVLKFKTFGVRMEAITNYLNERDRLQAKIRGENSYVVPDKPDITLKTINQIREYVRTSADPNEKQKAQILIYRLSRLLEKSYAFYGKK